MANSNGIEEIIMTLVGAIVLIAVLSTLFASPAFSSVITQTLFTLIIVIMVVALLIKIAEDIF